MLEQHQFINILLKKKEEAFKIKAQQYRMNVHRFQEMVEFFQAATGI